MVLHREMDYTPAIIVFTKQDVVCVGGSGTPLGPTGCGDIAPKVRVLEDNSCVVPMI